MEYSLISTEDSSNFSIIAFPALSIFCPAEIESEHTITAAVRSVLYLSLKSDLPPFLSAHLVEQKIVILVTMKFPPEFHSIPRNSLLKTKIIRKKNWRNNASLRAWGICKY